MFGSVGLYGSEGCEGTGMIALEFWLRIASLLTGVGALLGAYGLINPSPVAGFFGLKLIADAQPHGAVRGIFGGVLLMHAVSFTALAEAPKIGSCLAAAAGAAWLGQAAGRAVAAMLERNVNGRQIAIIAGEAAAGVGMWAPLWIYLKLIRQGSPV